MKKDTDNNYLSYADENGVVVSERLIQPSDPEQYDDVLKISNCTSATVVDCNINPDGGNKEDGVDIMRRSYIVTFSRCKVGAGRKYAFTIKGGSDLVILENVMITRHGGGLERVDIDIGNWSETTPVKTGKVYLNNVYAADRKPVRVRVGWAKPPYVTGGNVKVLFWQSLGLKLYCLAMRILHLLKK